MKPRAELFIELEQVLYNIEQVERQINTKIQDTTYYLLFGRGHKHFEHDKEIRIKALAYWKRRCNRILTNLKY